MSETVIRLAETTNQLLQVFPVMQELRPQLTEDSFVAQVERQRAQGYRLAYLQHAGQAVSCAGYRFMETLAWGKLLYVDDLVTAEYARSNGFGLELFNWLIQQAREAGCGQLHLDSGVHRFGAHRFYLLNRMSITSHHFALTL